MALDPITIGLEFVGKIADKIWPDPVAKQAGLLQLQQLQQTGELAELAAETDLAKGQQEINKIEAASGSFFVSGWRPCVGWICAGGLGYSVIIEPFMRFIAKVCFDYFGDFPVIDATITLQLLLALLGVSGLRSYEKVKGVTK